MKTMGKKIKRHLKEVGLYQSFVNGASQARGIKLYYEYIELCTDLYYEDLLDEFLRIIVDKKTRGLRGFVGYYSKNFSHVVDWLKDAPNNGWLNYDNDSIPYDRYMLINNIKR